MAATDGVRIGEVSRRTGLTERTLRYYEDLGLVTPDRDASGHRRYGSAVLARLYRIRLLRGLGVPVSEVPASGAAERSLLDSVQDHLATVDAQLCELSRLRERVRAVETALLRHEDPSDEELLAVLSGMGDEPGLTRRLTLLVYRDLEAMAGFLAEVFGFGPGPVHRNEEGRVVHAELYVGDGLLWLHREAPEFALASPATLGSSTACMAVSVVDVEAHYERVLAAGAEIHKPPQDMPYGVREYGVRDPEGGLWSFMQELEGAEDE